MFQAYGLKFMLIFPNPRSAMSFSFCTYDSMLLTICTVFDQDHFNVAVDKPVLIIIIATSDTHSGCRCYVDISSSIQGKAKIVSIYSQGSGLAEHSWTCKIHFEKNL